MFLNINYIFILCNSSFYIYWSFKFKNKILRTRILSNNIFLILIRPSIKATRDDSDHVEGKRRNGIDHQNSKACTTLPRTRQAAFIVEKREREKGRETESGRKREKIENVAGHGLVGRVSTMIVVSLETEWRPSFPETNARPCLVLYAHAKGKRSSWLKRMARFDRRGSVVIRKVGKV